MSSEKRYPVLLEAVWRKNNRLFAIDQSRFDGKGPLLETDSIEKMLEWIADLKIRGGLSLFLAVFHGHLHIASLSGNIDELRERSISFRNSLSSLRPTFHFDRYFRKFDSFLDEISGTCTDSDWRIKLEEKILSYIREAFLKLEQRAALVAGLIVDNIIADRNFPPRRARQHSTPDLTFDNRSSGNNNRCYIYTICHMAGELALLCRHLRLKCVEPMVFVAETGPHMQGRILTYRELKEENINVECMKDDSIADIIENEKRKAFLVMGSDNSALDGSIVNKVGSRKMAEAASRAGLPVFVTALPGPRYLKGEEIPIEKRNGQPLFDLVPPDLITKIITFDGIFTPSEIHSRYRKGREGQF